MPSTTPQQPSSSRATGKLVAGIGLAIAAAVMAITWQTGQRPPPAAGPATEGSNIASPSANGRPLPATAARTAVAKESPPALTPEQVQQRLIDTEKQRAVEAEAAQRYWVEGFAAQSVNSSWARAKEDEVRKIVEADDFDAYGVRPKDFQIECRSSLCKVTATFPSQDKAEDWMRAFTLKTAQGFSGGATQTVKQPNGEATVRIITSARM